MIRALILSTLALLALAPAAARADEGMWTFDNFPTQAVQKAYGVSIDSAWLDHVRLSTLRLSSGCSGAVVSRQGLAATNYHCVVECVQALSGEGGALLQAGFVAAGQGEERRCPGLAAEILMGQSDVTDQLRDADGESAREATVARLEKTGCGGDPRLRCEVAALYHGAQYVLYRFRRYDDVRLVFAPEFAIAFFGGDPDNFNFPRYDLDAAFIRLYRDGKPADTPEHLVFDASAPKDGEAVFTAGNPGGTERLFTLSQLEAQRDVVLPLTQVQRAEERGRLLQFAASSPARQEASADALFTLENSFKAFQGRESALADPAFVEIKRRQEAELKARIQANAELKERLGDPWADMAKAQAALIELFPRYNALERTAGNMSELYGYARAIVRGTAERERPEGQRLREYSDARLPQVQSDLEQPQAIDPDLEALYLGFWLSKTREALGADDPAVRALLGAQAPDALARQLVAGTRLADPNVRAALWKGGRAAVEASDDPLIRLALAADPAARAIRREWEQKVSGASDEAAGRIAEAEFEIYGRHSYPDATFTPRISYGRVAGWTEHGVKVGPFTHLDGLYARATGADPYKLPASWLKARAALDPAVVFDLTATTDIIGGNSGSPLIDANGRMIGLAFDGNIHSLGGDYLYDGALNRSISLSSAAIAEALSKVYADAALLAELKEP